MSAKTETYRLLKQDRERGIKLLFEQYSKKLSGYAMHHWKTEEDATWDLIYKTMYKVADTIDRYEFESEEKFASFIFKIFINYLRNHVRDTKTAAQGITEISLDDQIINNYSPAAKTNNVPNERMKLLQDELDKLEDWQRILLLMRSQEVSYNEISKIVGRSEDQLKVYYGRLKKQLAEKLTELLNKTKENVR